MDGKFSRLNVTRTDEIVRASLSILPRNGILDKFVTDWPKIEDQVVASIEVRASDRMRNLRNTLERHREREAGDITKVLNELKESIERELNRPEPPQLGFWTTEEQDQLRRNSDRLRARVDEIPRNIDEETQVIRKRYSDPTPRTFPVAVTFLVPESVARGQR